MIPRQSTKKGRRLTPAALRSVVRYQYFFGEDDDDELVDCPLELDGVIGCELVVPGLLTSPGVGGVVMPYLASTASLHAFCSLGAFASHAARSELRSATFAGSFAFVEFDMLCDLELEGVDVDDGVDGELDIVLLPLVVAAPLEDGDGVDGEVVGELGAALDPLVCANATVDSDAAAASSVTRFRNWVSVLILPLARCSW